MYTSELLKISEAYTKQMNKANITESTVVESTRRVIAVTDGNAWAVVDADTQEIIQQYDSADKLNKDVHEFGWLMVNEQPVNVSECGKQCNESYEEFYVKLEKEPFNILEDDCWQCNELLTLVRNNEKEEEFNVLAKEMFMDNAPTLTEFNDWCRFDYDSICEYLGLSDEEDVELDESGDADIAEDYRNPAVTYNAAEAEADMGVADGNGATGGTTPPSGEKGWWDTTVDAVGKNYEELKNWASKNPGLAMGLAAGAAGLGTALLTRKRRRRG
jgi:hypothetical protein